MLEGFTEIKKEAGGTDVTASSDSHYPWGTSISLETEMVDSLGVSALSVGDVVEVRAFAVVERKSEHEDGDGVDKSMCIQLTQLKVNRTNSDAADELYGGAS